MLHGKSDEILADGSLARFEGRINLIFTSPPFPLNRKKRYGNETGEAYIKWLCAFGSLFKNMLAPDGSIVVEMGNSWEPGMPVMSTLALRSLLEFQEKNDLRLCQEFIWHNPARLPSPAQWVNVERSRVKDSFTKLWWMAPTEKPKASNQRVLQDYSKAMRTLLKRGTYNAGKRPSEHDISETAFLRDNGGAIPSNVDALLAYIPRYVAVVGNMLDPEWTTALRALDVQYLTVSVYRGRNGRSAHEVEGRLVARTVSLGFARFSAIDNCLRINKGCGLPPGAVQIIDQFGNPALWTIREASGVLWISKDRGPALLEHEGYVQIIRTFDGRISLRPSTVQRGPAAI